MFSSLCIFPIFPLCQVGVPVGATFPDKFDCEIILNPKCPVILEIKLFFSFGDLVQPLYILCVPRCSAESIVDFELNICDTQPGVIGGAQNEFLYVGRLDNLSSSYAAVRALVDSTPDEASLANESAIRAIALFDHEEVGSSSAVGAGGPVMRDTITRVTKCMSGKLWM